MRHFEDFKVGASHQLGSRVMSKAAIVAFAQQFDRLPFHVDEEAAARTQFKGLIASGLHTLSVAASIVVDEFLGDAAMAGGAGMNNVRWTKPVRPGDEISVHLTISKAEPHPKQPHLGVVGMALKVVTLQGSVVMTGDVDYLFTKRPPHG